jgi:transposase
MAVRGRGDAQGADRVPECYIPPEHVLEYRALLELYHDLRAGHTGWAQRIQAVFFHQGATRLGEAGVVGPQAQARMERLAETQLSPVGQLQVSTALAVMHTLAEQLHGLRRRLVDTARRLRGARSLAEAIYGVGPMTSLALCCWLGGADRFSSSRKAVRFVGLDVTVRSSDSKRSPGRLSRQGPEVLRWLLFEAAKTSAQTRAPDHGYYAQVKERIDGNRAALSQARRIVRQAVHILADLRDDAFTTAPPRPPRAATR